MKKLIVLDDLLDKIDETFGFIDVSDDYDRGYDDGIDAVINIISKMPTIEMDIKNNDNQKEKI